MSAYAAVVPPEIRAQWDAMAVPQIGEELARLYSENERLQRADADADYWREISMAMQLQVADEQDLSPGLTVEGDLVLSPNSSSPCADSHSSQSAKQAAPTSPPIDGGSGEWPRSVHVDRGALGCEDSLFAYALTAHESH